MSTETTTTIFSKLNSRLSGTKITLVLVLTGILCTIPAHSQSCDQSPIAAGDVVEYRGESSLYVDVLSNDSDPDGQELTIVPGANGCGGTAAADFAALRLDLPLNGTDDCTVSYRVQDADGNWSNGAEVQVVDRLVFADPFLSSNFVWKTCVGGGTGCTNSEADPNSTPETAHGIVESAAASAF